jgi:serine/threonine protein kinase
MEGRLVPLYLPDGVVEVIGFGSSSFIGRLDDKTILKYPRVPGEQWERLVIEERMYKVLGSHPRIITCFGLDERGLKLEYAMMGTVRSHVQRSESIDSIPLRDRLRWCRQAGEALAYIHTKNIIHCDISTRNFLLDNNLDLKLSDFQGLYLDPHGPTLNGFALENCKSFLPRPSDGSDQSPTSSPWVLLFMKS